MPNNTNDADAPKWAHYFTTYPVKSLSDLVDAVNDIDQMMATGEIWYRGHAHPDWPLIPMLYRQPIPSYSIDLERHLYSSFQGKAWARSTNLPTEENVVHWLCLMRHYGLPTRLLDWSASPFVATYFGLKDFFAHSDQPKARPTIYAMSPVNLNMRVNESIPVIAFRNETTEPQLKNQLNEVAGRESDSERQDSILAVWPPEIDQRLLVQHSRFTIHSVPTPLQEVDFGGLSLARIDISPDSAFDIFDAIGLMGYRDSALFPDLEHVATELRNWFLGTDEVALQRIKLERKRRESAEQAEEQ